MTDHNHFSVSPTVAKRITILYDIGAKTIEENGLHTREVIIRLSCMVDDQMIPVNLKRKGQNRSQSPTETNKKCS